MRGSPPFSLNSSRYSRIVSRYGLNCSLISLSSLFGPMSMRISLSKSTFSFEYGLIVSIKSPIKSTILFISALLSPSRISASIRLRINSLRSLLSLLTQSMRFRSDNKPISETSSSQHSSASRIGTLWFSFVQNATSSINRLILLRSIFFSFDCFSAFSKASSTEVLIILLSYSLTRSALPRLFLSSISMLNKSLAMIQASVFMPSAIESLAPLNIKYISSRRLLCEPGALITFIICSIWSFGRFAFFRKTLSASASSASLSKTGKGMQETCLNFSRNSFLRVYEEQSKVKLMLRLSKLLARSTYFFISL